MFPLPVQNLRGAGTFWGQNGDENVSKMKESLY